MQLLILNNNWICLSKWKEFSGFYLVLITLAGPFVVVTKPTMTIIIEEWKDVPSYEGHYQISNLGRVKSKSKILKQSRDTRGHLKVGLSKNGCVKTVTVHLLVAQSFLGHSPSKTNLIVKHKNENRLDNTVGNLIITKRNYATLIGLSFGLK